MTVYVDDANIRASVRSGSRTHTSAWCHLFADSQEELHAFAEQLGLQRSYFQPGKPLGGRPSPFWHYDVTAGKRAQAIALGAVEVGARDAPRIMREREARSAQAKPAKRVMVTGSRTFTDRDVAERALKPHYEPGAVLVSGACKDGADALAEEIWTAWGGEVEQHPAVWYPAGKLDRAAGFKRNTTMAASRPGVCVALEDDCADPACRRTDPHVSHGTAHAASEAERFGVPVEHHRGATEQAQREALTAAGPADRLDYDAGRALQAGDLDTAARLIYQARDADPARAPLWDARQARIRQAMQGTTERRLKDAGIRSDDPALAVVRQYNAALRARQAEASPIRPEASRQSTAGREAAS